MKLFRIIFLSVMLVPAMGFAMNPELDETAFTQELEKKNLQVQEKSAEVLALKVKNLEYRVRAIEALLSKQEPAKPTVIETKQEEDTLKQLMKVLQLYLQEKGEPSKPAKTEESNYVQDLKSLINTFVNK